MTAINPFAATLPSFGLVCECHWRELELLVGSPYQKSSRTPAPRSRVMLVEVAFLFARSEALVSSRA